MRRRGVFAESVVLVGLVVASCTGGESTGTTAPTTAVTGLINEETEAFPAGEPLDLLVLTDSSGSGLADRYAPLLADGLDREVRVHDWAIPGEPITAILNRLQNQPDLADTAAGAEIIVLYGYPGGLEYELPKPNILTCLRAAEAIIEPDSYHGDWAPGRTWEPTPAVATVEDWQPYRDVLDDVYDEIWELRDGRPTILRTYDAPNGFLAPWRELGIDAECRANWEVQAQVVREAAEANGAGFVSMLDVLNGPDHDQDPVEKGWFHADDPMHASAEGLHVIAETLAAHGSDLNEPPR